MKKLMLAGAMFFLTATGLAQAADMPLKALPPPPTFTWTGLYAGAYVGGMWAKTDSDFVFPPPASWQQTASVGTGGGIIGVQYQWGNLVFGAEGNLGGALSSGLGTAGCNPAGNCFPGFSFAANSTDAIWSAGGRVGWAFGYWLPYVSGGYANASFSQTLCAPGFIVCQIGRSSHEGGYVGGGLDWAVWGGLVVGLEYRHYNFQTETVIPYTAAGVGVVGNQYDTTPKFDTLTFRLTYLFSPK
jgi:outer membrane immunogenic protein